MVVIFHAQDEVLYWSVKHHNFIGKIVWDLYAFTTPKVLEVIWSWWRSDICENYSCAELQM